MSRLETINKLKNAEERKQSFEAILNDVSDFYCKEVSLTVQYNSTAYHNRREYDHHPVDVDKTLFIVYLKHEIASLEENITVLIGELTND